jgi:nucleoside-diphosphate-sugar epimerase
LGSEGFIGRHLIDYFVSEGHEVFGCDLFERPSKPYSYFRVNKNEFDLKELLNIRAYDVCINAAGNGNVPASITDPVMDFESNCMATIRTLESIRLYSPDCRYIHISSAAVYGNPSRIPVIESELLLPISPYGWHKLVAEKLCIEYNSIFNIKTAFIRPFSVYGPGLRNRSSGICIKNHYCIPIRWNYGVQETKAVILFL